MVMKRHGMTIYAALTMLLAAMATGCSQSEQPTDTGGITVCIGTGVQTKSAINEDDGYYTYTVQDNKAEQDFYYSNGFSAAAYSTSSGALLAKGSAAAGNSVKLRRTSEPVRIVAAGNAPDFAWPDNIGGLADVSVPVNVLDASTVVCVNDFTAPLDEEHNYYIPNTVDKTVYIEIAFSPVSAIVLKNGNDNFKASSIRVTSAAKYVKPFANSATVQTASGSADGDALDYATITTSGTVEESEKSDEVKFNTDGIVLYIPKGGPATIEVKGTTAENGKIYDETYTINVPAYNATDGTGNKTGAVTGEGQAYQWVMTPDFDRQDRQYTMTATNAAENVTVVVGMQDYRRLSLEGVTAYGNGNPFQAKATANTTNKEAGTWTYTVTWEGNGALSGNTTVDIDGTSYDLGSDGSVTIAVNPLTGEKNSSLTITSSYSDEAEQTVDFVCSDPGASCTVTVLQDPNVAVKPVKIQPNLLAEDQWVLGGGSSTDSFSITVTYSDGSTKTVSGADALALIDNSDGNWTISGSTLKAKDATTSAELNLFYSEKGRSLSFSSIGGIVKDSDMFSVVNANAKVVKDRSSTASTPEVINIKTYHNSSIALLDGLVRYSCNNTNMQVMTDNIGRTKGYKLKGTAAANGSLNYSVTGTYSDDFDNTRRKTVYQATTVYQRRYRYYKVEMDGNSAHQHQSDEREENHYTVYVTYYDSVSGEKSIATSYIAASYDQDGDLMQEMFEYVYGGTKVRCQTFDTVTQYFECDPDGNALATGYVTEGGKYYYYVPIHDLTDDELN